MPDQTPKTCFGSPCNSNWTCIQHATRSPTRPTIRIGDEFGTAKAQPATG